LSSDKSETNNTVNTEFNKKNKQTKKSDKIKNFKDVFSEDIRVDSDSEKYDSEENGYYEINDTLSGYSKNLNNFNTKKITPLENEFTFTTGTKNDLSNNKDLSYNPNSANKNGKIYKINI